MNQPFNQPAPPTADTITYEQAFGRLEEILEKMNAGNVSLDNALHYYEEADKLIQLCSRRLVDAERKIEMIVKSRNQEMQLGADGKPLLRDYGTHNNAATNPGEL